MTWQRPTRKRCERCGGAAAREWTASRQCEPGPLAVWRPRCTPCGKPADLERDAYWAGALG